jgi:hypothetical protein
MAAVFLGETIHQVVLVFVDTPLQVASHSDVDCSRLAGDDVDAVAMLVHKSSPKQVPPLRIAIDEANRNAPVGMTELSSLSNPWVRHRVQKIRQEIYCDVRQADGEDASLDQVVVAVADGLDGQAADAGPGEDGFGYDGAS